MILAGLLLQPLFQKVKALLRIPEKSALWIAVQRVRTFLLFSFSVSFGRAGSMHAGWALWSNLFAGSGFRTLLDGTIWNMGLSKTELLILLVCLAVVWLISKLQLRCGSLRERMSQKSIWLMVPCIALLVFAIALVGGYNNSVDFIYGNF